MKTWALVSLLVAGCGLMDLEKSSQSGTGDNQVCQLDLTHCEAWDFPADYVFTCTYDRPFPTGNCSQHAGKNIGSLSLNVNIEAEKVRGYIKRFAFDQTGRREELYTNRMHTLRNGNTSWEIDTEEWVGPFDDFSEMTMTFVYPVMTEYYYPRRVYVEVTDKDY